MNGYRYTAFPDYDMKDRNDFTEKESADDLMVLNTMFSNKKDLIKYKSLFMKKKLFDEYLIIIKDDVIEWYDETGCESICFQIDEFEILEFEGNDGYDEKGICIHPKSTIKFIKDFNKKKII